MKTYFSFLPVAVLALYLTGCASLKASIPYSKVLTPEVKSERHQVSLDVISTTQTAEYEISSDASERPFVEKEFTRFEDEAAKALSVGGDIQLFDRLEVGLSLGATAEVRAKYQLIGESLNQSQVGNQSLAVFATSSSISYYKSGDQNGEFGYGGYDWNARVKSTNSAFGLSYGYRLKEDILLYTGFSLGRIDVNGDVVHEESDDKTSPKVDYDIDHKTGSERTIGAGLLFSNNNWNLDLSLNNSRIELEDVVKSEAYGNIRLTYLFGSNSQKQKADIDPSNSYVQPSIIPKESWQLRDFVALASSYFVGFGTGQAIQNRWSESGMNFAIADGASLAMLLYGLSSCSSSDCNSGASTMLAGYVILVGSRIWQVADVIVDSSATYKKSNSSFNFVPTQDGAQMNYAFKF